MQRIDAYIAVIATLPIVLSGAPAHAAAALSSSANDFFATFTSDDMTSSLGPANPLAGSKPPYSKTHTLPTYTGTITLPPFVPGGYPITANLNVSAAQLTSAVSGMIGLDNLSASASTSDKALNFNIVSNPPPGGPPVIDFLDAEALGVAGAASYSVVLPSNAGVNGSTTIKKLHIGGTLLNGHTIDLSNATPAPNTSLYSSSTLNIVANEQIITALVSCPGSGSTGCTVTPTSITVHPIAIHFINARIENGNVTGEIDLGESNAQ